MTMAGTGAYNASGTMIYGWIGYGASVLASCIIAYLIGVGSRHILNRLFVPRSWSNIVTCISCTAIIWTSVYVTHHILMSYVLQRSWIAFWLLGINGVFHVGVLVGFYATDVSRSSFVIRSIQQWRGYAHAPHLSASQRPRHFADYGEYFDKS